MRRSKIKLPAAFINLTSLLDITFVLLISFMVVAPALRYNVELELPKVGNSRQVDKKKPATIGVTYNEGTDMVGFYLNGNSVSLDDLPDEIKALDGFQSDSVVALEADRKVPWEHIARLINELKMNEIHNIGIVTERGST